MDKITCTHCGSVDDYTTTMKSNNKVATCNACGRYIKNIPYSPEAIFHFGRYKDMKVADLVGKEDLSYLEWFLANVQKASPKMKVAISKQITFIKKNL